jgi:hypothetical protein
MLAFHVATAALAIYGAYALWAVYQARSVTGLVYAVGSLGGSLGLYRRRPWAQYVVYTLSLLVVAGGIDGTWEAIRAGRFPYDTTLKTVLACVPAALALVLCIVSCIAVFRYFRVAERAQADRN